ncbi:PREDICTED: tyrosine-protein kinase-like otk [Priapulus caudatus]|uniref:Tyrosine-protein kinase-like otk n=1 Tax=Priapulus caudatus TaxID=37621 RepID=A0ABM1F647_PRICU|nr:PREDICTED: tyrosine-protein kinase-like otk [Priapulus caudatus]
MVKEFAPELASHTRLRHERQATNIGGLSHPNVHGLVGIVRDPNPSIVYEFLEWGDLKSFLLSNMPKTRRGFYQSKRDTISRTLKKAGLFGYAGKRVAFPLTTNDIVTMAMQVAGGMAYLSRNGCVVERQRYLPPPRTTDNTTNL